MQTGLSLADCAALIEQDDARCQQIDAAAQRAARADPMRCDRPIAPVQNETAQRVLLQCAANVKPMSINWLWRDWLPAGKLTILAGAAGTGKTTLALTLAAVISRGGRWPDDSACANGGNVLIWSGEDDAADTIVPRLMLAQADLHRVHFVQSVTNVDGELLSFDPARDIVLLNERIANIGGARLLIVDPVLSAVSGDAHRANDVRRDLQPLIDLASAHGCAVIGISHFGKGTQGKTPVERVIGSQAFGALARMVLVTAKDEGEERRILARAKSNIARDDGGFSYTLEQGEARSGIFSNRIVWGERIEGSARDILGAVEENDDERGSLRDEARDFLAGLLADGPVNARELKRDAEGAGYSWSTMFRAASDLKVEKRKLGMKEGWLWALPKNSDDEHFTKISEHGDVKSSGMSEIFDNGAGLPSAPLSSSPEDFRPTE